MWRLVGIMQTRPRGMRFIVGHGGVKEEQRQPFNTLEELPRDGNVTITPTAEGFGAIGVRVDTIDGFGKALAEAVASRRFTLIDTKVDPSEYWEQM